MTVKRLLGFLLSALGFFFATGCATCSRPAHRDFVLRADSFAFTNELVWSYEFSTNGDVVTRESDPAPEYPHRCFPMVRCAREFFYHAAFAPGLPRTTGDNYAAKVRQIVRRSSRCPSNADERIVIPGYADLFSFSREHPALLRHACGGAFLSYFQRGNWRMVFPVTKRGTERMAQNLITELGRGQLPIVHVYRFPDVRLNHAIMLYHVESAGDHRVFFAYDPNSPGRPAKLVYDPGTRTFIFERNQYFGGGPVRVYEVYRGLFH